MGKGAIRNSEGYMDKTPYTAIQNVDREADFYKLLHIIFDICALAGFRLEGRITLVDQRTGKVWT